MSGLGVDLAGRYPEQTALLEREFRDDVVRVARNREDGLTSEQIAADRGVHPMTLPE
ncbi:hypothetical protein [Nocardia farcinica]|uniref:hypothetical protein n=1 Tax=Nocardia farcinica TaxID=37329 RepID=UPI0024576441|nr:hypothetical protein [Nocardia farcinica]